MDFDGIVKSSNLPAVNRPINEYAQNSIGHRNSGQNGLNDMRMSTQLNINHHKDNKYGQPTKFSPQKRYNGGGGNMGDLEKMLNNRIRSE